MDALDLVLEIPALLGVELDIACKSCRGVLVSIYTFFSPSVL